MGVKPRHKTMIHTEHLSKFYNGHVAVEDLSLDVGEGEVLGLLGPNGAGKTTTVRLWTRLIAPGSGTAVVNGCTVGRDDKPIRRSVGLLTEMPGLYERLSAAHTVGSRRVGHRSCARSRPSG